MNEYHQFTGGIHNPKVPASTLEVNTCDKYYRFLQVLDAYNIPLVNLTDTPPVVPGESEEARGLIRHIGKIVDVYATTTVPKIGVVLREAYADAGSLVMSGLKGMGADLTYAWPIARFGVEASTLDMTVAYAKERVQFGRSIGSFQAMQHYMADMWVDILGTRNLVYRAGWAS